MSQNVKETICDIQETDVHVDAEIAYFLFITRQCKMCGMHRYMENIKQLNPTLETDSNLVQLKRWELVKKDKVGMAKMDIVFKETAKWKPFQQYIADIYGMALHLVHKYWQYPQFRNIQTNLKRDTCYKSLILLWISYTSTQMSHSQFTGTISKQQCTQL